MLGRVAGRLLRFARKDQHARRHEAALHKDGVDEKVGAGDRVALDQIIGEGQL